MIHRKWTKFEDGVEVATGHHTISWSSLRAARDRELRDTDYWALTDREITAEQRAYRVMLRNLPSDFPGDDANEACDHWADNPRPEE